MLCEACLNQYLRLRETDKKAASEWAKALEET